jgi:maleylacetate reductase
MMADHVLDQRPFTFAGVQTRVRFGRGIVTQLAHYVAELPAQTPYLLCSASSFGDVLSRVVPPLPSVVGTEVVRSQHGPQDEIDATLDRVGRAGADALVVVGGGSALAFAKGVALSSHLPILAVPTTYSGSEATSIWGLSRNGQKVTGRDTAVRPVSIVYDPDLFANLPPQTAAASALNALAHLCEALYAPDANPVTDALAAKGVERIGLALGGQRSAAEVRWLLLEAAWLAGIVLDQTAMGLHHKLCHTLGGQLGLDHARLHAVMLPFTLAYNLGSTPNTRAVLATALATDDPVRTIASMRLRAGLPTNLATLGVAESSLAAVAAAAVANPYANPRPIDADSIHRLLHAAWSDDLERVG